MLFTYILHIVLFFVLKTTEKSQACQPNSNCYNTPGSYNCVCKYGYRLVGNSCQDIDDCQTRTDNCNQNAECKNLESSYSCQCKKGWEAPARSEGRGPYGCIDVDECMHNLDNCAGNQKCVNVQGSFECK